MFRPRGITIRQFLRGLCEKFQVLRRPVVNIRMITLDLYIIQGNN